MNQENLFIEKQKMKQWWVWLLLIALVVFFGYGIVQQLYWNEPFGTSPASDVVLVLLELLMIGFIVFFRLLTLETMIHREGIQFRMFPLQLTYQCIRWDEISLAYIRKYAPMKEFGGWGIKSSLSSYGTSYTMSGNKGLQLELKNKTLILIGTQSAQELEKVLQDLDVLTEK